MTKSESAKFLGEPNNFRDTNHVMDSLDALDLEKDQDWENETTTWVFGDGSKVVVSGNDVTAIAATETPRNLPHNLESVEDTRMMGTAGVVYLGECDDDPAIVFRHGEHTLSVYADGSLWLSANISEVYPSVGDYLAECEQAGCDDDPLTQQLRAWSEADDQK